jgi:hypothetical protein
VAARIIIGLGLTVIAFAIAGRRVWWLKRLAFSGQPTPERVAYAKEHAAADLRTELTEVLGQRKLLKWTVPGAAHAATFWGFIVLLLTIIEAYGNLFSRTFAIPGIGHWAAIGFLEDLTAVGVLAAIITFTVIRLRNDPHKEGRKSRFFGSHITAAWVALGMIFAVIATLLLYRGAQINTGAFPYPHGWAFASWVIARALAPLNVLFSRRPDGLGPLEPMRSGGKMLDFEEADPDTDVFGIGKVVEGGADLCLGRIVVSLEELSRRDGDAGHAVTALGGLPGAISARVTGCGSPGAPRPSTVVTSLPRTDHTGVSQE